MIQDAQDLRDRIGEQGLPKTYRAQYLEMVQLMGGEPSGPVPRCPGCSDMPVTVGTTDTATGRPSLSLPGATFCSCRVVYSQELARADKLSRLKHVYLAGWFDEREPEEVEALEAALLEDVQTLTGLHRSLTIGGKNEPA